jgi:6-pyruvoyltetrahydropterin/6-carboxytetrahydropterin synthase
MYELTVKTHFAAAHSIQGYDGPCASLHGHTWLVEVVVIGLQLDRMGMLIDFKEIKAHLNSVIEELDHRTLNDLEPFQQGGEESPTAENLARYIFRRLKQQVEVSGRGVKIDLVRVWESPDASAAYREVD